MQVKESPSKITWARPIGAITVIILVIALHASNLKVPAWADVVAPLGYLTWYVDRSLWKFYTRRL